MHFEEESNIYIWSKFQLDTCMFDSNYSAENIWFRILVPVPDVGSAFYSLEFLRDDMQAFVRATCY